MANAPADPPRRRLGLSLLAAFLALFQLIFAGRALQIPPELAARLSLPLPLEIAAALAWTALFALASVLLVKRRPNALRYSAWVLLGFAVYSVARLLLFARADYDRRRLPFLVVSVIALVSLVLFIRMQSTEKVQDGSDPQS